MDKEGYIESLIDCRAFGGYGEFSRQSIKPYLGFNVTFAKDLKAGAYDIELTN